MCLYPKLIKNRKYTPNKKNKGIIPVCTDERLKLVPVKCNKCMECMKANAREWQVRLSEEIKNGEKAQFINFTFNDIELAKLEKECTQLEIITGIKKTITLKDGTKRNYYNKKQIPLENAPKGYKLENKAATLAIRRFLENWRKETGKSVKHWIVTELGSKYTERIHLHGILFTDNIELIKKKWKYGNVVIGQYVNQRTINYIVKYIHKTDSKHKYYKPKILCSAGIGAEYINRKDSKNNAYKTNGKTIETYRNNKGYKFSLPIYYRNKIYTEKEREKLWLEKLDKDERYILGIKIKNASSAKGQEIYFKILKTAQEKNTKLGYQDDKINWNDYRYEIEMRKLKQNNRQIKLKRLKNVA